ncbi:outer membrane assembly protein [Filimonas lacunae]|nr:outer membrane assembly protein [Filimonas lacunae]
MSGIAIAAIIALLFLLPAIFPGFIAKKIKTWTNKSIQGELNFSKARLSFFRHFPSLTLTLHDFTLKGSAPFSKDTLISAEGVSLGLDLSSIFSSTLTINKIFVDDAHIHVLVNEKGEANYNVYASKSDKATSNPADSSDATLKMESIVINNTSIIYDDASLPMLMSFKGFNYTGSGDFEKAIFDLDSHIEADSVDFSYDHQNYFLSKKLQADLITKINTHSLSLLFEKNDLKINSLPVHFKGHFDILSTGYNMDFKLETANTDLHDIFSAMPAEYLGWLANTDVRGFGDINASLAGMYSAASNQMPSLELNMKIRDGYVANKKAPAPIKNLFLNLQARVPQMKPDSLFVNMDSIYFNIDKDYVSSVVRVNGLKEPEIYAKLNAAIDLEKWDQAIGFEPLDMKGRCNVHLLAEGKYATSVVKTGLREVDTVITSIPKFTFHSSLQDGYIKYASVPEAIRDINFSINASCPDNDYKHTTLSVDSLSAKVLSNYIKGFFKLYNAADFSMEGKLQSVLHLSDIAQVYPLDSMTLKGDLAVNITTKGHYVAAKRVFPVTEANLTLKNGFIQTKYYPEPLQQIQVQADISSSAGNFRTLKIDISPVSFLFAGQPFSFRADLRNLDNLRYAIASQGTIDVGKLYKLFAVKGYNLKGFIQTNLSLRGLQSDATAGNYDKLANKGTLKVRDIALYSELFPQPLWIKNGLFRFDQDKMWFDAFQGKYGSSKLTMNGYLSNVIAYATQAHAPLQGTFDVKSDFVKVDELMAFSNVAGSGAPAPASTGVILVPDNLNLHLAAVVGQVQYQGLIIKNANASIKVDSGAINLQNAGFELAGCKVNMDANYKSLTPKKAEFDYHINASEFDVQRMYKEVELFRNMVTAAAKAQGIISLDYQLSGKLNGDMQPIYPSLKGGGVLSVKQVKMRGFKLLNAVGSSTGREGLKDADLSKIDIKSTINNNIITIERTKMRVAGFRPRFEGQVSFDGRLNLSGRLGLPPLGIIGIPFSVTGTQENPKVKLRRAKDSDKLEETSEEGDQ